MQRQNYWIPIFTGMTDFDKHTTTSSPLPEPADDEYAYDHYDGAGEAFGDFFLLEQPCSVEDTEDEAGAFDGNHVGGLDHGYGQHMAEDHERYCSTEHQSREWFLNQGFLAHIRYHGKEKTRVRS